MVDLFNRLTVHIDMKIKDMIHNNKKPLHCKTGKKKKGNWYFFYHVNFVLNKY